MPTLDLQEKYAASSTRQAINRAIRAELTDGAEILDSHHRLTCYAHSIGSTRAARLQDALHNASKAKREAENLIRARYGMPLIP